ncbi:uncharacterized protein LOC117826748 [Xyrichtys novacula]|nr:uncharacterized protein LOC117826748 [Xyrichtys novacula]
MSRIPHGYKEAMQFISGKLSLPNGRMQIDSTSTNQKPEGPAEFRWRSSFKPVDEPEEGPSEEKKSPRPKKDELYNPYDPASSDSESEMPQSKKQNLFNPVQDPKSRSLSPKKSSEQSRWDSSVLRPGSRPLCRLDYGSVTSENESQGLSPSHMLPDQQTYSPETESIDPVGYYPTKRPLDHRGSSPERVIPSSSASTPPFPLSYGGQRANREERVTVPEYRREVSPVRQMTTVRLSPPPLKREYRQDFGYSEKERDQISPPNKVARLRSKEVIMGNNPICCDLCDIEVANGQELMDHLESKTHWDTLEHIQQHNNYDDIRMAFLQDILLYRSSQCSRAIEDRALPALQDNDHMTKVEVFHCAACKVFVSTSASSVETHITSQEHLINTEEFEVKQRHVCLIKAETMMKELKPQYELFLQGRSSFE